MLNQQVVQNIRSVIELWSSRIFFLCLISSLLQNLYFACYFHVIIHLKIHVRLQWRASKIKTIGGRGLAP